MRIITQNGSASLDFNNIVLVQDWDGLYAQLNDKNIVLGKYSAEQRVTEIFKEIHDRYQESSLVECSLIYEMPLE